METQLQNHPPNTTEPTNQDPSSNLGGGGVMGNSKNSSGNSNYLCRQSSTRWTPTTDQIRILKDLYYNNGIRSPSADQIQRISARLRQYGKIEGKNVFYWFQNHKARERQKKRFTGNDNQIPINMNMNMNINFTPIQRSSAVIPPLPPNHLHVYNNNHKQLYPNISPAPGVACSSSGCSLPAGVVGVGQIGGCANYGSVAMEKSFRDCSISQGEIQNCGWVGVDQYSSTYHTFLDKRRSFEQHETLDQEDHDHQEQEQEQEEEEDQETPELETLPLFPMHGDHHYNSNGFFKPASTDSSSGYYSGSCYRSGDYVNGGSRASLELSLNSYTGWSMDLHH